MLTVENRLSRAGVSSAALSRAGFAILSGPQGYLYSGEWIGPNQRDADTAALAYVRASRPSILCVLALQCLRLALQATLEQAKAFLRTRLHLQARAIHHPLS